MIDKDPPEPEEPDGGEFMVTTGLLGERDGIRITQEPDAATLTVEVEGEGTYSVPVRPVPQNGKTYMELTTSMVTKSPQIAAVLEGRHRPRKALRVHQLVAMLIRRAVLTGSDHGKVAAHHVDFDTGNNVDTNVRALFTPTHIALHQWAARLPSDENAAYVASVAGSANGFGDLPDDLLASVLADVAVLEEQDPPFDEAAGSGPDPDVGGEPAPSAAEDLLEGTDGSDYLTDVRYYPGPELFSGGIAGLDFHAGLWVVNDLERVGHELGEPSGPDTATMHGAARKMLEVAEAIGCPLTAYLLREGHQSLVTAVRELFEGHGARFAFDAGVLYWYDFALGRYEPANDTFERQVLRLVAALADECRRIRLVASVWGFKEARIVLSALPKLKSGKITVSECRDSLFPLWRIDARMNSDQETMNVANGLLDVKTRQLRPHTPGHFSSIQFQFPFDPDAECPLWHGYLEAAIPDPAERAVVQEFDGYCLLPNTDMEVAMVFTGSGGTGKSLKVKITRKLVGEGNCSTVALDDLNDKFRLAALRDKLLNVVTEVNPAKPLNDSRFKALISGDPLTSEQKFKDPGTFTPYARFLVACNTMPKVVDETDATYRRLLILRFNQKFVTNPNPDADPPEMKRDPELFAKLDAEMSGILNWALDGLDRLLARGHFDVPTSMRANVVAFREDQDNALRYLHEACVFAPGLEVSATDLYREYTGWCRARGEKPYANNRFGQVVSNHQGVEARRSGNKGRHYRGVRPADAVSGGGDTGSDEGR